MDSSIRVPIDAFNQLVQRVQYALETQSTADSAVELEIAVTRQVDVTEFTRVMEYCVGQGLVMLQHEATLDITFANVVLPKGHPPLQGVRVSVVGADHIAKYYATGALEHLPAAVVKTIRKRRVQGFGQLDVNDYNLRANLRTEESCSMSAFDAKTMRTVPKTFRLKSRASFLSRDGLFRYDCTKVHQSDGTAQHPSASGLSQSRPRFEVEIEMLPPWALTSAKGLLKKLEAMPYEDVAKQFLGHAGILLCAMLDSPALMSGRDHASILRAYEKLTGSSRFGGAQPVTLERRHVLPPEDLPPNSKTILSGYSVTAKFDGARHLLFFAPPDGRAYMLGRAKNVATIKYLGCSNRQLSNTLLDGEYMSLERTFAAFDAYYVTGQEVRQKPLQERLRDVDAVVQQAQACSDSVSIVVKDFRFGDGPDMQAACREVLDTLESGELLFETDGLIFTPTGPLTLDTQRKALFKWKPPHMNTVDFLVGVQEQSATKTTYALYCGHRQTVHAVITPMDYLRDGGEGARAQLRKSRYVARRFAPAKPMEVQHLASDKYARCENGDPIDDRSVVECRYDPGADAWRPMRVRWDKVQEMYAIKRITANDYETAASVWRSIVRPVSKEVLTGEEPPVAAGDGGGEDDDSAEDRYYNREEWSDLSASATMRSFHNWIVKRCVLLGWAVADARRARKKVSVIDVGCGKGGDLMKFVQLGVDRVFGMDKSVTNIRDVQDGVYARLQDVDKSGRLDYVFVGMDASMPFAEPDDALAACATDEDRDAVRVLWQGDDAMPRWSRFVTREPFDIASMMFDLHYFFDRPESLEGLLSSLEKLIRPGGVVVGACLDGKAVAADFEKKGDLIRMQSPETGQVVFQLENKVSPSSPPSSPYGNMIGVYVESIHQVIDEPLVDFDELVARMAAHGFDVEFSGSFRDVYNDALEDVRRFTSLVPNISRTTETQLHEQLLRMSAIEREYSFLHMYWAFRKAR